MKKYLLMREIGGAVEEVDHVWAVDYGDSMRKFAIIKNKMYITSEMEKHYWITGGGI